MNIEQGPRRIDRLAMGCKVADFQLNQANSTLLLASNDNKLQSYFLKSSVQAPVQNKILPMVSLGINCVPDLFSFSGKKNIIHCDNQLLIVNNKKELPHKDKIKHLLVDELQIGLTTCLDTILISSIEKGAFLGELHSYGSNISALFWKNSLVISGDERGAIKLWDINKQQTIHVSSFYNSKVNLISSYVDFIHTNLYFSWSKQENKMAFHDMRTYRPIKINSIAPDVTKIIHNQSGKVFMLSPKQVHLIDIYQGYNILGVFSQLRGQKLEQFKLTHPHAQSHIRKLTDIIAWKQFIIAGCDNGCIQVYNSDTLQCIYAYGLCEGSGIQKLKCIDHSVFALEQKGILSLAQFL